jgi:hypothetical protein
VDRRDGGCGQAMTQIRDMHRRPVRPPSDRPSLLMATAAIVVAFALGGAAVLGWQRLQPLRLWGSVRDGYRATTTAPDFGRDRIGRAETAPLLAACLTPDVLDVSKDDVQPGTLLQILNAAGMQSRVTSLLGAKRQGVSTSLATAWGKVADCVYRQNSWNLCDPDNRALAVDAVSAFVSNADEALAGAGRKREVSSSDLRDLDGIRERILRSLQSRVRNGELIGADFGPLTPSAVKRILQETKTLKNGCADRP